MSACIPDSAQAWCGGCRAPGGRVFWARLSDGGAHDGRLIPLDWTPSDTGTWIVNAVATRGAERYTRALRQGEAASPGTPRHTRHWDTCTGGARKRRRTVAAIDPGDAVSHTQGVLL